MPAVRGEVIEGVSIDGLDAPQLDLSGAVLRSVSARHAKLAGAMLVFVPSVGEFVIPDLLGGSDTLMIGKVLWNEFFDNNNWPMASARVKPLIRS